jgi:hypothetical protein
MKILRLTVLCICLAGTPAAALDYEDEFPGPVFSSSSPLQVQKLDIFVSEGKARYSYTLFNFSAEPVQSVFMLTIPPYKWTGTHRDDYKMSYSNLSFTVAGKKVGYEKSLQVTLNGKDIAAELMCLRVDPLFNGVEDFSKKHESIFGSNPKLVTKGYLEEFRDYDSEGKENHYYAPLWTVAATYSFAHEIPAQKNVVVEYEYEPVWGYAKGTLKDPAAWEISRLGGFFSDAATAVESRLDDPFLTQWLTLSFPGLGTPKLPENVSLEISIDSPVPQYIYAVLGAHNAKGKNSVQIAITNEPVSGPIKIVLLRKQ